MTLEIFCYYLAAYCGILAICIAIFRPRPVLKPMSPRDQRAVLRGCRLSLWAIRRELDALPATHEVHRVYNETRHTEKTINRVESEIRP